MAVDAQAVQYSAFRPEFSGKIHGKGRRLSILHPYPKDTVVLKEAQSFIHTRLLRKRQNALWENGNWRMRERGSGNTVTAGEIIVRDAWVYTPNPYAPVKNTCSWFHFGKDGS